MVSLKLFPYGLFQTSFNGVSNKNVKKKLLTISNNALLNDITVNYFSIIMAPLLKAFIKVIMTEDLTSLNESEPPKKGKFSDVGTTDEPFLCNWLMSIKIKKH